MPIVDEGQPGRTGVGPEPERVEDAQRDVEAGAEPERDEQDGDRLEDGDEGRRRLACPEHPERAASRLDRRNVAEDDARQDVGQRRADERGGERRGHDREIGLRAEGCLEGEADDLPGRWRPGSRR